MGILNALTTLPSIFRGRSRRKDRFSTADRLHACGFEQLESRRLMAFDVANLNVGMVYREQGSGQDEVGDRFEITFSGGAPGTQLTQVTINTDKLGDGLSIGDVFFDTASGGQGAFGAEGFELVSKAGIDSYSVNVTDGGTLLTLNFQGFDVGEKFVFTIDVDEQGFIGSNAVAEGNEFEGSLLGAKFTAPTFQEAQGSVIFFDAYDSNFSGKGLDLPPDSFVPPGSVPDPVHTAGAAFTLKQVPLPITISGTVFEDVNLNNNREPGDNGIAGVSLSLEEFNGSAYVTTGKTTTTDANGNYKFEGILPGKYRVVEAQPSGLFSVGAKSGSKGGTVVNPDVIAEINLVGGDNAVSYDFAEARPASLSGHVYHDANNNGVRDTGETGIADVSIVVQRLNPGSPVDPIIVTTDANGLWVANGLRPGEYGVAELQPAGWLDGFDKAGNKGGTASNPGDSIEGIVLVSGAIGIDYDFGELLPSRISGMVHADLDGDCLFDPDEPLLAGVTVKLLDAAGNVLATTLTNAEGEYEFTGLAPGIYGVEEVQPTGYYQGGSSVGSAGGNKVGLDKITQIVVTSGTDAVEYNFCEMIPAKLSGMVHADLDGDCEVDEGEPMLAGVTIWLLDANGTRLRSTLTDENGEYEFLELEPGVEYGVEEVQPNGYYEGGLNVGSSGGTAVGMNKIVDIVLGSGEAATEYNFCEQVPASIRGMVHADLDGDCEVDDGEPMLAGVTIWLLDANGTRLRSTLTDENGEYEFLELEPGVEYGVEELQPGGYFEGGLNVGSSGGTAVGMNKIVDIVLASGEAATEYNFCEQVPASIRGMVHADLDGDCEVDDGEPMLAGVTIWLLDANGTRLRSTLTDGNGEYEFLELEPGVEYGVEEVQPGGYFEGGLNVGSSGGTAVGMNKIVDIVLGSGESATEYNFCELLPASITGIVHADRDGDCEFDSGEPLLGGVTVWLLDSSGNRLRSTVTNQNGRYEFVDLAPGTYGVEEVQPTGYFDAGNMVGSAGGVADGDNKILSVVLGSGVNAVSYNFCEEEPVSLCGGVYQDLNENGLRDAGEAGIGNVVVRLLDANNQPTGVTVVTAADGTYCFMGLRAGTYGVSEDQPSGYYDGTESVGDKGGTANNPGDSITGVTLAPGNNAKEYNFGELPPGTISGYVFQDGPAIVMTPGQVLDVRSVRDGQRTDDDTPLAGVRLRLSTMGGLAVLDINGEPITTVTDQNGYYEFRGLAPGQYAVLEDSPSGYIDGLDTPGEAGAFAINSADQVPAGFAVDPRNDAILRITVTPGVNSENNNFSEVQTVAPSPPSDVGPPQFGLVAPPVLSIPAPGVPALGLGGPTFIPLLPYLPRPLEQPIYVGASGYLDTYSWHLSIIDAGTPRGSAPPGDAIVRLSSTRFDLTSWTGAPMDHGQWQLGSTYDDARRVIFGLEDGIPVTGDFNGDGVTDIGVFADGEWFIDLNGNHAWDETDLWIKLGAPGDRPVTGDWDGDGKTDIGVFGPEWTGDPLAIAAEPGLPDPHNRITGPAKNLPPKPSFASRGERTLKKTAGGNLRSDVIDHVFRYGVAGYMPVTGDWNGDGTDAIGIFFGGIWRLDSDGDGRWTDADEKLEYGGPGDLPVVGDFNGDGFDEIGVYRRGVWYIDQDHNRKLEPHDQFHEIGDGNDLPVVGDWDGDGTDEPGVYEDGAANLPVE